MTRDEPGALFRLGTSTLLGALLLTGTSCATGRRFPYVSHAGGGISAWMRGGYGRSSGHPQEP